MIETIKTIVISIGGISVLLVGLSSWLGKIWADKLMASYKARHDRELSEIRIQLTSELEHKNHLLIQKIELYKQVSSPLIALIVKAKHQNNLTNEDLEGFDIQRLETAALLCMFAPNKVFEEYNLIIDYIYDSFEGKQTWEFSTFRNKALIFLSEIRRDINLHNDDVTYTGSR
ncbi:hypothetical protein [Cerasicoccus maritimus]|uniref:hypothetical protein n=1 Tax=Cerasicoccus maritimus TaxID=490089 RepID=UPI002852DAB4|nr:hypothetical protein [Cerasicoccus maritimus]